MHVKNLRGPIAVLLVFFAVSTLAAERQNVGRDHQALQRILTAATLGEAFGLSRRESLLEARSITDSRGVTHTHYIQTYLGVPVWGQQLVVGRDSGRRATYARGALILDLANDITDVSPGLSSDDVLRAMKDIAQLRSRSLARLLFQDESSELVIYFDGKTAKLAFAVRFFADTFEGGQPTRPTFLVDANSGEILFDYEGLTHDKVGTGPGGNEKTGQYEYGTIANFDFLDVEVSGSNCTMNNDNVKTVNLNHGTTGSTAFSYGCPRNTYKEINGAYSPLNDAHFFGGVVFDMYNAWLGMPPLDFQLMMRVHYSTNYENAFWNGSSMTFGDGQTRFYPLVGLDVVAHEVSHGFTERVSGLIYSGQSGGINESFSDIAGEATEMYMQGSNDFKVGAEIFKESGKALRYMENPPEDGNSIGHTSGYYSGMNVHYSSGIFNKAFHLLATTEGWNVRKAFEIFAKANDIYWTSGETFDMAYDGLTKAAVDLGYSEADVTAAFYEVGVPVPLPGPACEGVAITELSNGVPDGNESAATGEWKCWTLDVPAGALTLDVVVRDTSKRRQNGGDADLYIRHGSSPVVDMWEGTPTGVFDCGSYSPNSNEQCSIESPADGIWYFAVYAWSSYLSMEIKGTSAPDGSELPSPSGVITATASVKGGKNKFVQVRWEGAESPTVDIYRVDAKIIAGTANDGSYKDNEGGMGNLYKVCEEGLTDADACSDLVTAN